MNSNFFTLSYWFNIRAGALHAGMQSFLIFFILILVILVILFSYYKKQKGKGFYYKLLDNLQSFSVANLIIGAFLLFFTYQEVLFLSARFWFLLWFALMIFWLYHIFKISKEIPKIKEKAQKEKEFKKYIP